MSNFYIILFVLYYFMHLISIKYTLDVMVEMIVKVIRAYCVSYFHGVMCYCTGKVLCRYKEQKRYMPLAKLNACFSVCFDAQLRVQRKLILSLAQQRQTLSGTHYLHYYQLQRTHEHSRMFFLWK